MYVYSSQSDAQYVANHLKIPYVDAHSKKDIKVAIKSLDVGIASLVVYAHAATDFSELVRLMNLLNPESRNVISFYTSETYCNSATDASLFLDALSQAPGPYGSLAMVDANSSNLKESFEPYFGNGMPFKKISLKGGIDLSKNFSTSSKSTVLFSGIGSLNPDKWYKTVCTPSNNVAGATKVSQMVEIPLLDEDYLIHKMNLQRMSLLSKRKLPSTFLSQEMQFLMRCYTVFDFGVMGLAKRPNNLPTQLVAIEGPTDGFVKRFACPWYGGEGECIALNTVTGSINEAILLASKNMRLYSNFNPPIKKLVAQMRESNIRLMIFPHGEIGSVIGQSSYEDSPSSAKGPGKVIFLVENEDYRVSLFALRDNNRTRTVFSDGDPFTVAAEAQIAAEGNSTLQIATLHDKPLFKQILSI